MRRLKFWTTTLLVFGLLMLLGAPFLLMGRPAAKALQRERMVYALTLTTYAMVLLLIFLAVVILAWRIVVKQREEYQETALQNLKDLVEGTLHDHERKPGE